MYPAVNFTENSVEIQLGDFLTNFIHIHVECHFCNFVSMLCCRGGRIQFYITELKLDCDAHVRVLTKAAAPIPVPFLPAKLCSNQPCFKFLSSLEIGGDLIDKSVKDLGALIGNCKHLKRIKFHRPNEPDHSESSYCVCDFLGQIKNRRSCTLQIGFWMFSISFFTLTSAEAVKLAGLLPRFSNITQLNLGVSECCTTSVTTLVLSITHKTLKTLGLRGIRLSPAAAAALGKVLPETPSLLLLWLSGADGSILTAKEMKSLFGGLNKPLPLRNLHFSGFSVRGSLSPLTESFRFFPELRAMSLEKLNLDERDLCDLLKSFTLLPRLVALYLCGNPLGHAVTSVVPHLTNLPELLRLYLSETGCSNKDECYVLRAVRPSLHVFFRSLLTDFGFRKFLDADLLSEGEAPWLLLD